MTRHARHTATHIEGGPADREAIILAEQIDTLYDQAIPSMIGNIAIGLLTAILFYNRVPDSLLFTWLALIILINLGRHGLALAYAKRKIIADQSRRWMTYFLFGVLLSGLAWGSSVILFREFLVHEYFYLLAFILGGMAGGAAPILASVRYAYTLFLLPTMVPVAVMLLLKGDLTSQTMAGMFTVFILIMLMTALRIHRLTLDSIELRLELERLAHIDQLTGIPNRRAFDIRLQNEWARARREGGPLSLILIDIDHFKPFNDTLGHQAGDLALRRVAAILNKEARRPGDIAARLGGEEFALLLPGTDRMGAHEIAEHLRQGILQLAIAHPANDDDYLSISLGVSCAEPSAGMIPSSLISQADIALYDAKANGRNCVKAFREPGKKSPPITDALYPKEGQLE